MGILELYTTYHNHYLPPDTSSIHVWSLMASVRNKLYDYSFKFNVRLENVMKDTNTVCVIQLVILKVYYPDSITTITLYQAWCACNNTYKLVVIPLLVNARAVFGVNFGRKSLHTTTHICCCSIYYIEVVWQSAKWL